MKTMKSTGLLVLTLLLGACQVGTPSPTAGSVATPDQADSNPQSLTGKTWQWISFTSPVEQFEVDPASYRLTFDPDGTLQIVADCNLAQGQYAVEGSSLSIEIGPTTLALCPGDSRSEQFLNLLPGAAIFFFEEGNLYIDLMADGGTFRFEPIQ